MPTKLCAYCGNPDTVATLPGGARACASHVWPMIDGLTDLPAYRGTARLDSGATVTVDTPAPRGVSSGEVCPTCHQVQGYGAALERIARDYLSRPNAANRRRLEAAVAIGARDPDPEPDVQAYSLTHATLPRRLLPFEALYADV